MKNREDNLDSQLHSIIRYNPLRQVVVLPPTHQTVLSLAMPNLPGTKRRKMPSKASLHIRKKRRQKKSMPASFLAAIIVVVVVIFALRAINKYDRAVPIFLLSCAQNPSANSQEDRGLTTQRRRKNTKEPANEKNTPPHHHS